MGAFEASYDGIGDMLRSDYMQADMLRRALQVKIHAIASAPVESGHYKESFDVSVGVVHRTTSRAQAVVRNTADYALWVEFGSQHNPRHRTLGKALDSAR